MRAKTAATLADLAREFQVMHVGTKLKQGSSAGEYDRVIDKRIVPRLGSLKSETSAIEMSSASITHCEKRLHRQIEPLPSFQK